MAVGRRRSLGFWRSWALVVGTMIGSGIFLLPAVLAPYGRISLLGWIVAGAGTLFIALSLGSLARRIPKIGGPYAYTRAAFGDLPGFLIAWGYWISVWSASAAIAVAFSGYLGVFIPAFANVPAAGAGGAIALIWLFTAINVAGVRTAGIVQLVTTLLKLLPLLVIAGAGMIVGDVAAVAAENPQGKPLVLLVASVAILTMWSYVGMEAATIPAEDVIAPQRTIPRALVAGTLTATAVYVLATLGVMMLVPVSNLSASVSPFADAASAVFGTWGARFIGAGAIVSIVGTLNSNILLGGQMPRAAALDGLFPAWFDRLNANGAPAIALVVSAILASTLIVMNYTQGLVAAFTLMILLSTFTTLVPYAASAAADLTMRLREGRAALRPRSVAVAVLAILFSIFAIIGAGLEVVIYGTLLLAAGLPVYFWVTRSGSSTERQRGGPERRKKDQDPPR